jgi:hypothetical protein
MVACVPDARNQSLDQAGNSRFLELICMSISVRRKSPSVVYEFCLFCHFLSLGLTDNEEEVEVVAGRQSYQIVGTCDVWIILSLLMTATPRQLAVAAMIRSGKSATSCRGIVTMARATDRSKGISTRTTSSPSTACSRRSSVSVRIRARSAS